MRRILILLLAISMLLCVSACGKQDVPAPQSGESVTPESAAEQQAEPEYAPGVVTVNTTDGGTTSLDLTAPEGCSFVTVRALNGALWVSTGKRYDSAHALEADTVWAVNMPDGVMEQVYTQAEQTISDFALCPDGTLWVQRGTLQDGIRLTHIGADGSLLGEMLSTELNPSQHGGNVVSMAPLADGSLAVVTVGDVQGLAILAPDGSAALSQPLQDGALQSLISLEDGTLLGGYERRSDLGDTEYLLASVDPDTGAVTPLSLASDTAFTVAPQPLCGDGDTVWLTGPTGAVGSYERAAGTYADRFTWTGAGVTDQALAFLRGGGSLWAAAYENDRSSLRVFSVPVNGDARKTLTLGVAGLDFHLREAIAAFNQDNPNYRVEVKDYAQSGVMWYEWRDALNLDILSGEGPDMIVLTDMVYEPLARQGLLADMTDYLDNDPALRREDLFGPALEAGMTDGKLLSVIPAFCLQTLLCQEEDAVEGGLTPERLIAMAENTDEPLFLETDPYGELSEERILTDRAYAMQQWLSAWIGELADTRSGVCHFDSQEFIGYLNALKNASCEVVTDASLSDREIFGMTPLRDAYFSGRFDSGGSEAPDTTGRAVCGYPTPEGGKSLLVPLFEVAASTQSEDLAGCWEFMRFLLLGTLQTTHDDGYECMSYFPTLNSARAADEAALPGGYGQAVDDMLAGELLLFRERGSVAAEALDLLFDDLISFLNGQLTAEQAAANIQSRVGLYLSEQG